VSDPAPEIKIDPISTEGMDVLFAEDGPDATEVLFRPVPDQTAISPSSVRERPRPLVHPITVDEAARILKISSNAVCKRLRKGTLSGQKIPGKFKDEWLVEGAGLIEVVNPVDEDGPENVQDSTSSVQDQTPISPDLVQDGPSLSRLVSLIEKQSAKLEAAAGQIGYLQAQLESQARLLETKEAEIKLLTDSQHKGGWWVRFCSWFVGR